MEIFVALVVAFAVGLTAVGSVAFFMAERYVVAFVCFIFALFLWIPQMIVDINEPWFLAGDIFLACYCFVFGVSSEDEATENDNDNIFYGDEE